MKFIINLPIVLLLAFCFTSCSDDSETMVAEVSVEQELHGNWVLSEIDFKATVTEPLSALTFEMEGKNSESTLEINILENGEADLSGLLSMEMNVLLGNQIIPGMDIEQEYNESRLWQINSEGEFEFFNVEDDFRVATISKDTLIFYAELSEIGIEEVSEMGEIEDFKMELIFVKS